MEKSKLSSIKLFLFDMDEAGKDAQRAVKEAIAKYNKKKFKVKPLLLQPTDDMKKISAMIKNYIPFTIEHLLSIDAWQYMRAKNWVIDRTSKELLAIFGGLLGNNKSIDDVIEEQIDDTAIKDTIVRKRPDDTKKDKILKWVQNELANKRIDVIDGFCNTISELEKEFII